MAYLDLTHHISEATPVYPGDPKVEIKPAGIIDQAGSRGDVNGVPKSKTTC